MSDLKKLREFADLTQFEAARRARIDRSRLALAEGNQLKLSDEQRARLRKVLLCAIRERRNRLDDLLASADKTAPVQVLA